MARILAWLGGYRLVFVTWLWRAASLAVLGTALIIVAAFMLRGDVGRPNVRARWQTALAPYGYSVVYPMREDLHVGDIFLSVAWRCKGVEVVSSVPGIAVLGSLPRAAMAHELATYYRARPVFPASRLPTGSGAPPSAPGSPGASERGGDSSGVSAAPSPNTNIFVASGEATRLRQLSLPGLQVGDTLSLGVSWLPGWIVDLLPPALSRMFVDTSRNESLNVTFTDIEEAGLPTEAARRTLSAFLASDDARWMFRPDEIAAIARDLWQGMETERTVQCPNPQHVSAEIRVVIVGRVLYARGLEYTDLHKAQLSGGLGAEPADNGKQDDKSDNDVAANGARAKLEQHGNLLAPRQSFGRALAFAYEPIISSRPCNLFAAMAGVDPGTFAERVASARPAWAEHLCPPPVNQAGAPADQVWRGLRTAYAQAPPGRGNSTPSSADQEPPCTIELAQFRLCTNPQASGPGSGRTLGSLPLREPGRGPSLRTSPDRMPGLGRALQNAPPMRTDR